jgi:hypothetical protein
VRDGAGELAIEVDRMSEEPALPRSRVEPSPRFQVLGSLGDVDVDSGVELRGERAEGVEGLLGEGEAGVRPDVSRPL